LCVSLVCLPVFLQSAESHSNGFPSTLEFPIEFRQGSPVVQTSLNGSLLRFKLDTGFGVTTIHPDLVETLQLEPAGTMTIIGIAGEEKALTYGGAKFDFGRMTYSPRRIVAIPSDKQRGRRGRDGILGAGFFRRFVVEIHPLKRTFTLREPKEFSYSGNGRIIPFEFRKDTPIVEAAILSANGGPVRAKFEIDTGCDGDVCLGHDFVEVNKLDGDAESVPTGSRVGVGGNVDTRHARLPPLLLGDLTLDNLTGNFFMEGSPAGEGLAGHIGMGALKRFNVIFDYSRKQMILEPAQ
jgi:predicted aspartyl protease